MISTIQVAPLSISHAKLSPIFNVVIFPVLLIANEARYTGLISVNVYV